MRTRNALERRVQLVAACAIFMLGLRLDPSLFAAESPAQLPSTRLEEFFRRYLEDSFSLRPLDATELGDHRFDNQLSGYTPGSRRAWVGHLRQTLARLPQKFDYATLPRPSQIDYEIFEHDLKTSLWLEENTHPFEEDPRTYSAFINDSVYLLLVQSTLPKETNIANALARIEKIPEVVRVAENTLTNPPRTHTETAIRQNRGAISFYQQDIFDLVGDSPQLPALRQAAAGAVEALRRYQRFLEQDLLPRAHGDWRLGKEQFYHKLELTLDAGVTADDVLADAQKEFDRVVRDMYVIARQLWSHYYFGKALPADDEEGRRVTIRRVLDAIAQEHGQPEKLVQDVTETVANIKQFIEAAHILPLPEPDHCQIIEMPEFQRGNSTAFMNSPPPLAPKASGFFAVSPPPKDWDAQRVKSYLEEYNSYMDQILTIHEAYPGHYVQLEYANRNPSLIRKVLGSGVYIEGWAVYTEQMMLDQGYGKGDLALRLTQLKFYLRAVANTILDHKMHCSGMTEDEAYTFLTKDAFQAEGEARLKVIRSEQSSVQLSTYFTGRMAHYRLRQRMERELGDRFDLSRYHQAVLEPGPVPVKYLPELVRKRLGD